MNWMEYINPDGIKCWKTTLGNIVKTSPEKELLALYLQRAQLVREGKYEGQLEEAIEKVIYPKGKKKDPELEIGDTIAIYRLLGSGGPKLNGQNIYKRLFIKRIGYETYIGDDQFIVELDNADEEDYQWYMSMSKNNILNK